MNDSSNLNLWGERYAWIILKLAKDLYSKKKKKKYLRHLNGAFYNWQQINFTSFLEFFVFLRIPKILMNA